MLQGASSCLRAVIIQDESDREMPVIDCKLTNIEATLC